MKRYTVYRSAVSGQRFADENPSTTVAERVGPVRALIAKLTVKP